MDFYYVQRKDGSCVLICTRCFETVASTSDSASIETSQALHRCSHARGVEVRAPELQENSAGISAIASLRPAFWARRIWPAATILAVILLLYAVPTWAELWLIQYVNPWISVVVLGDVIGCVCILAVLKKPSIAIAVYLITGGLEALAFGLNLIQGRTLIWIVDSLPTLAAVGLLLRSMKERTLA